MFLHFFESELHILYDDYNDDLPISCFILKSKCNNLHMTFKTYSWPLNKSLIKIKTITEQHGLWDVNCELFCYYWINITYLAIFQDYIVICDMFLNLLKKVKRWFCGIFCNSKLISNLSIKEYLHLSLIPKIPNNYLQKQLNIQNRYVEPRLLDLYLLL